MVADRLNRVDSSIQFCTVGIMRCGEIAGTGFFINKDGQILTCFHVVGDCSTGELYSPELTIKFGDNEYRVEHVFSSPQPEILDFAILQVTDKILPQGAALIPLGIVNEESIAIYKHEFLSYGYRSRNLKDNAAFASGKIVEARDYLGAKILQLNSESSFNNQMREGMSGSPVYDTNTCEITGMFFAFSREGTQEIIPMALSLESIAGQWEALQEILDERHLWRKLADSHILQSGGQWLTEKAFEELYSGFAGLVHFHDLGANREDELLTQIWSKGKTNEFINYLKECQPGIAVDHLVHKRYDVRFLNREDEKKIACESLAPPYIFFEGPMGYGKTRFLAEIRKEHFRRRWLCVHLDANEAINNIVDLTNRIGGQITLEPDLADCDTSPEILALRLGGRINDRVDRMRGTGLLITLDHAEKLPREIVKPLKIFLRKLSVELNKGKKRPLRLRAAGRHGGARWEKESTPIIVNPIMLSPFQFKYVEEAVEYALPGQKDPGLYAAHLLHASAGHPHCMAEGIKKIGGINGDINAHFSKFKTETSSLIHTAAEGIRRSMRQDFNEYAPLAEKLCVFPILDRKLLSLLIQKKYIDTPLDQYNLEEKLLVSHYYDLEENCLHDHIARRVLAAEHHAADFSAYKEQCKQALGFYEQRFSEDDSHAALMFLAVLELELILAASEEQKLEKKYFFGPAGIMQKCKRLLELKPAENKKNILTNLANLLKFTGKADEFRILLIFTLRADVFDPGLYKEFVDMIDAWR